MLLIRTMVHDMYVMVYVSIVNINSKKRMVQQIHVAHVLCIILAVRNTAVTTHSKVFHTWYDFFSNGKKNTVRQHTTCICRTVGFFLRLSPLEQL